MEFLHPSGYSLVILGENETGKSSFVDALEFYFTGTVSHLEGAQGVSSLRHAPHIRSGQGQTKVVLGFDRPDFIATRTLRSLSDIHKELLDYHTLGASARFILRRKNLLHFILAQRAFFLQLVKDPIAPLVHAKAATTATCTTQPGGGNRLVGPFSTGDSTN